MVNHSKIKPLAELSPRRPARVSRILDHRDIWQHLHILGIHPGDHVELLHQAPLGGPIHIRCDDRDLALDRNLATKILVEILAAKTNAHTLSEQEAD